MVSNRLKNLAQLARRAVRDVRQVVNELAEVLTPRREPALVRIPVRNNSVARGAFKSPYTNPCRYFSTSRVYRGANPGVWFKPRFIKPLQYGNLAQKLWPYSAFRRMAVGTGPFPGGLYRNFVNINARNFSSYGGSASREAVQNLTSSLRCMFNNGGDTLYSLKMSKKQQTGLSYHGSMSQREAEQTFKLARVESTGVERFGSYVEFAVPRLELAIPSVSFMSSEIINSIEDEFEDLKEQIDKTSKCIQKIFDAYGSLPMEKTIQSVRIHFPNLDSVGLENLLIDLGIEEGVVYSKEDIAAMIDAEEASSASSMTDLSELLEDNAPGLLSTDSDSDSDSLDTVDFFPVLSSSGGYQYASPIEISESSSPVLIAHSEISFSDMSIR